MKEIKAIIKAYDSIDWSLQKAALATVVRVEGSSYRRTGARMLVMDDGQWVGGISGGCLEGDALKRAKLAIYKSEASLITYDTTTDNEHQIGVGLGCNGIIDVLLCPLDFSDKNNPVELLKHCAENSRETNVIITITGIYGNFLEIKAGDAFNYLGASSLSNLGENAQLFDEKIQKQIEIGHSAPQKIELADGRKMDIFIEILPPEIHLVLFGHQYDVYPLVRITKELGWRVSIVANPLKINKNIAAFSDEIIAPENAHNLNIDPHTAMILMAHDYKTDKENFKKLLKTNAPYIGLLGPRVRSEKIFNELKNEGIVFSEKDFERIFAPIGLDIGAVSPEEIALSLVAEIRAIFSKREGKSLRLRNTPIHERD